MAMTRDGARLRGLYAVTPAIADTQLLVARVRAAIEGGAALVQYRWKDANPSLALVQARALVALCRAAGVPLIVNDSLELAAAVGADGVHLGRDDAGVREARIALPDALIGASCYADPERARAAAAAGADYVAVGSVFASPTKPGAVRAPLALIGEARAASGGLPVAAIGGIDAGNARAAIEAGADMLAVISAVFEAADVRAAARLISHLYDIPTPGRSDVRPQPQSL
jgi:thiamine-phosphate pyrophosphorylase